MKSIKYQTKITIKICVGTNYENTNCERQIPLNTKFKKNSKGPKEFILLQKVETPHKEIRKIQKI